MCSLRKRSERGAQNFLKCTVSISALIGALARGFSVMNKSIGWQGCMFLKKSMNFLRFEAGL